MRLRMRHFVEAARDPRKALRRVSKLPRVRKAREQLVQETQRRVPIPPLLSVIVPVYNVEDYVEECLQSLRKQTLSRMEIIVVNDGSTDRSAEIVRKIAMTDPARIRVVDQANAGLGAARNTGIALARGQFLTFVDSDDLVPKAAYRTMVRTLQESGSDFVVGSVERQRLEQRFTTSWVHRVHDKTRLRTTIKKTPAAIYDCFAWNKVYRTKFFREQVGSFPEGVLYEDQVPSVKAYLAAQSFDILTDVTYYWRLRVTGDSITQTTSDIDNLRDRLKVQDEVNHRLLREAAPEVRRAWLSDRVLGNDITLYTRDVDRCSDEYWELLQTWIRSLFRDEDWTTLTDAKTSKRLLAWLIAHGSRDNVVEFVQYERDNPGGYPTELVDGVVYADLPFRKQPDPGVPDALYAVEDVHLKLDSSVRRLNWVGPYRLEVTAWAYIRLLDLDQLPSETFVLLRNKRTGEERPFSVTPRTDLHVTERVRHTRIPYDRAGFSSVLDLRGLFGEASSTNATSDQWEVWGRVTTGGIMREAPLISAITNGSARMPAASRVVNGGMVLPQWRNGVLTLRQLRPLAVAKNVSVADRLLTIEGELTDGATEATLVLGGTLRGAPFSVRKQLTIAHGQFSSSVSLPRLANLSGKDIANWKPYLLVAGAKRNIVWNTKDYSTRVDGNTGLRIRRTLHGNLAVEERPYYLVVEGIDATETSIVISGQATGIVLSTLKMISERSEVSATLVTIADGKFVAQLPLKQIKDGGRPVSLPVGSYQLCAEYALGSDADSSSLVVRPLLADRPLIERVPFDLQDGTVRIGISRKQELRVQIKAQLTDRETSAYHQNRLQRTVYQDARSAEREEAVLFEAFKGQYSACNPLAVCQELQRRETDLRLYWSVTDLSVPVPEGTTPIVRYSEAWYQKLGQVRYLVNNNNFPKFFEKAENQTYLQTWHGTPLKRIGHDIHKILFSYRNYLDTMDREAATWDYLISPNEFSSDIFPRAFAYSGPVLQTGYPRNDTLLGDSTLTALAVRDQFGIAADQKILLYAPTWRDDQYTNKPGEYQNIIYLDIEALLAELGSEYVVLVRGHSNTLAFGTSVRGNGVVDVTSYPNINDLYEAADVLITDYSSVMFDFAVTGKPILYLVPDLDDYRDRVRGFYFDFENESPGPLLSNTAQVAKSLRNLADVNNEYASRYSEFRNRFNSLEDGHAAQRVVDAVFGTVAQ